METLNVIVFKFWVFAQLTIPIIDWNLLVCTELKHYVFSLGYLFYAVEEKHNCGNAEKISWAHCVLSCGGFLMLYSLALLILKEVCVSIVTAGYYW